MDKSKTPPVSPALVEHLKEIYRRPSFYPPHMTHAQILVQESKQEMIAYLERLSNESGLK